jgi:hypothetical protein
MIWKFSVPDCSTRWFADTFIRTGPTGWRRDLCLASFARWALAISRGHEADRSPDLIDTLAALLPAWRGPAQITHSIRKCYANGYSPSCVAVRTRMASTVCVRTWRSRWPAGVYQRAASARLAIRQCHAWKRSPTRALIDDPSAWRTYGVRTTDTRQNPWIRCTAISRCRCSMPIAASDVFSQSLSMTTTSVSA